MYILPKQNNQSKRAITGFLKWRKTRGLSPEEVIHYIISLTTERLSFLEAGKGIAKTHEIIALSVLYNVEHDELTCFYRTTEH